MRTIAELTTEDEASFRHVALYGELKEVLRRDKYTFRVLPETASGRWDRALLLNLTFWGASVGGDVLVDDTLPADVVAHAAWHHLAAKALSEGPGVPLTADALFLGESIASAFDVYLVGRLLGFGAMFGAIYGLIVGWGFVSQGDIANFFFGAAPAIAFAVLATITALRLRHP